MDYYKDLTYFQLNVTLGFRDLQKKEKAMRPIEKMATQDEFEEIRNLAQKIVNKVFKINCENIIIGKERDFSEIDSLINQFRILLERKGEMNIQKDNDSLFEEIIRPLHLFQIKRSA